MAVATIDRLERREMAERLIRELNQKTRPRALRLTDADVVERWLEDEFTIITTTE